MKLAMVGLLLLAPSVRADWTPYGSGSFSASGSQVTVTTKAADFSADDPASNLQGVFTHQEIDLPWIVTASCSTTGASFLVAEPLVFSPTVAGSFHSSFPMLGIEGSQWEAWSFQSNGFVAGDVGAGPHTLSIGSGPLLTYSVDGAVVLSEPNLRANARLQQIDLVNFNRGVDAVSMWDAVTAVPEPSGLGLVLAASFILARRQQRKL